MKEQRRPASNPGSYAATWSASWAPGQYQSGVTPIDPATLDPYLYFRADTAAGGSITTVGGAVSSWSQVTTSGGNQINRTLEQGTANKQPQHDNTDKHVTFDNSDDDMSLSSSGVANSITQAGIWIAATKRGVWAQEINSNAVQAIDALGPDQGFPRDEDVYAITLLPNTLKDSQIEGVVLWFLENTNAAKATATNLGNYRRNQSGIVEVFPFGLDTSSTTDFNVLFYGASALTKFPDIDTSSGTGFNFLCYNCISLTSFPQLDVSSGINFSQSWYNCESLTSFPLLDFSSATSLYLAWGECTGLTTFPAIDASSTTNFQQAWYVCSGLTSFGLVDTSSGTNFNATWRSCTNLTSFPAIDTSSGVDFSLAWYNCNKITSFPTLDVSNGTEFRFTWGEMRSLTAFPALDTSKGEDFEYSWYNCIALTSFPSININKGKDFRYAWQLCTSLTTFPANFFDSWNPDSIADNVFQHTWDQCVLTATSVENILVSLAASGKHGTANGASGGTALSNAVIDIDYNASTGSLTAATNTAINTLISRGWSVKINGVLTVPSLLALSPAAAYSLRSFDSSADPNVVNVRRSSDSATQDFKASEITDGTLATWVGSGNDGHVTTWYDQSGNSRDAVQTSGANQPKIVSSGTVVTENSKPAVDMYIGGSSGSRLVPPASFRAANINNYSLFTAQKPSGASGLFGVRLGDAPDNRGYLPYNSGGTNYAGYGDTLTAISLGSPPTDSQLLSFIAGSTQGDAQAFLDGSSQGSVSLQDHAQLGTGALGQGSNTGTMQEVVIFHNDQSVNRTAIENNINTHYSIY